MPEEKPTPNNRKAPVEKIKVRVVKQPVRHGHRTYLGPSQGKDGPLPGETFDCPIDRAEAYGKLVEKVD